MPTEGKSSARDLAGGLLSKSGHRRLPELTCRSSIGGIGPARAAARLDRVELRQRPPAHPATGECAVQVVGTSSGGRGGRNPVHEAPNTSPCPSHGTLALSSGWSFCRAHEQLARPVEPRLPPQMVGLGSILLALHTTKHEGQGIRPDIAGREPMEPSLQAASAAAQGRRAPEPRWRRTLRGASLCNPFGPRRERNAECGVRGTPRPTEPSRGADEIRAVGRRRAPRPNKYAT